MSAAAAHYLMSQPPAHADTTDAAFLRAVHNHGIKSIAGGGELVELGHSIWGWLADGYSMNAITGMGNLYAGSGMTPDDVKFVVQTSAAAYCPEYVQLPSRYAARCPRRWTAKTSTRPPIGRCLSKLDFINRLTFTHRPTLRWLADATRGLPVSSTFSVLDVGYGHGDLLRVIARWADRRGLKAQLSGIDLNPHSAVAARSATPPSVPHRDTLATLGAGSLSLDWLIFGKNWMDGWPGLLISVGLGLAGAIGQLLIFYRPPSNKPSSRRRLTPDERHSAKRVLGVSTSEIADTSPRR